MLSGSKSATSRPPTASSPERHTLLRAVADIAIAVLIAPACAACGDQLERPTSGPICQRCWRTILPLTPPLCLRCGDPLPSWRSISRSESHCPRCRRRDSAISRARALGAYDGALRRIVHALKYGRRRSIARPLARLMREQAAELFEEVDVAVAVPLHRARRRARGFNQAEELARHLGLPARSVLRRTRATPSQTDLPAAQRHANVRGAFAMRRHVDVRDLVVLLVDDVSTTGATLEACGRTLRAAGAREVRALTAARVVAQLR
jgi:ComF family protein